MLGSRERGKKVTDQDVDHLLTQMARATDTDDIAIDTIVSSPFLPRRLQVRIRAEMRQRAEASVRWGVWLTITQRAVPVLVIAALLAVGWFWSTHPRPAARSPVATSHRFELGADPVWGGASMLSNEDVVAALWRIEKRAALDSLHEEKQ